MSLKKISVIIIIALLTLMVVGLGQAKKITLTFMTPLSGADGAYMDKIISSFNKEHPDIEVVHLVLGNSLEYKTKLSTGIATKQAPQILLIRKMDMPIYIEQDQFKTFTASELKQYGIDINDVYPELRKDIVKGNKIYGVPLDCWIFYMAYNKGNFAKAGLDPNKPPKTKAEFEKAMEALKKITPKGITPYYENPTWSWLWVHLLWQFGGDLLTPDFKQPAFQDAGAKALRLLMEFQDKGYFPKASVDPGPAFESGQASVLITGVWTSTAWKELFKENFGAAPAPLLGTKRAVFGGSHVLALPKVMAQDPQVLKASMTWMKYLWDHAIEWYAAGQTPARKSISTGKELKDKLPYIYTIAQQLPYVKTFQMFPYISEVLDTVAVYLEDVLITRKLTPEKAMSMAAEEVMPILEDYWAGKGK